MAQQQIIDDPQTESVIGAFYDVYNGLGFGFLECHYLKALELELLERGHAVGREVYFPVMYKGHLLGRHRLDRLLQFGPEPKIHRFTPRARTPRNNPVIL